VLHPGALKLSNHHHLPSLAERISAFLEERLDWEAQQQQQVRRSSMHTRGACATVLHTCLCVAITACMCCAACAASAACISDLLCVAPPHEAWPGTMSQHMLSVLIHMLW
jgi:hypothetical protein